MEFIYTDDFSVYDAVLSKRIKDCICKHVMYHEAGKAKLVYDLSSAIGYDSVMWGYGSGIFKDAEMNRKIKLNTIQRMIYKGYTGPFRVVIDENDVPWIDNLHSAIRDVFVFGDDVRICDTRCYIIDMRTVPVTVVDVRNTLSMLMPDIFGAIISSRERIDKICPSLKNVNYTISDFMMDNCIYKSELTISDNFFDNYIKKIIDL